MAIFPFRPSAQKRFHRLVQAHLEGMYAFAYRLTGTRQDAEDLVQDVVVKLYPRLSELETVEHLRPWLNRVLYRQFVDSVRRRGRRADRAASELMAADHQADWFDALESDDATPELVLDQSRLGFMLDEAMERLSPDQRTLLLLHDVDGWRQEDVAEVLGVAVGTVKSRLHRSRAALRKYLQQRMEPGSDPGRVEE
ncbi:RNA polymerase sigma factor [Marinobacter sp. VGCF2001]|uniref:RNA polymerase sigma factor n=1 Tax=Marinobacter sp. VGCF2001 TaxID=3417189 RepID=UPI003CEB4A69